MRRKPSGSCPGSGMGIVQPKGLEMLKEIVDAL